MTSPDPVVLLLTPVLPLPSGSGRALRAWDWLQELTRDLPVHVLVVGGAPFATPADYPAASVFSVSGAMATHGWRRWLGLALPLLAALSRRFVSDWRWPAPSSAQQLGSQLGDAAVTRIIVFRLYLHEIANLVSSRYPGASLELDMDDLEASTRLSVAGASRRMGRYRNALSGLSTAIQYYFAGRALKRVYDVVYLAAENDVGHLPRDIAQSIRYRPNRIRVPAQIAPAEPLRPFEMLFVGTLDYPPNEEAVRFLISRVLPLLRKHALRDDWRFRVIGTHPPAGLKKLLALSPGVELIADAASLDTLYRSAHAVLVPLRAGGGTKLKVLEAFAHRRPVVSTAHGVRGLGVTAGLHYLHAERPAEFTAAVTRLASDPALADRLAQAGWAHCKRFFGS